MPRLRNRDGVTVSVSDETAGRLGSGWTRVDDKADEAPKPRRSRKTKSDD
ncbi:DUF7302 family protein [Propionibacteriaceae bacterium Y1700]